MATICVRCVYGRGRQDPLGQQFGECQNEGAPITNFVYGVREKEVMNKSGMCSWYKDRRQRERRKEG